MSIFLVSPAIPDLKIPRGYPCGAIVAPEMFCGATPASMYSRSCGVISHTSDIWLCPVHAGLAAGGMAICRECARRGGMRPVTLLRLTEPIRL